MKKLFCMLLCVLLLASLAVAWVLIGVWQLLRLIKQKKEKALQKKNGG